METVTLQSYVQALITMTWSAPQGNTSSTVGPFLDPRNPARSVLRLVSRHDAATPQEFAARQVRAALL